MPQGLRFAPAEIAWQDMSAQERPAFYLIIEFVARDDNIDAKAVCSPVEAGIRIGARFPSSERMFPAP